MTTAPNTSNDQNTKDADAQLKDLAARIQETGEKIDATNEESRSHMNSLQAEVDESVRTVEKIYTDLDRIEKNAGDELDTHMLQQAEDLASE